MGFLFMIEVERSGVSRYSASNAYRSIQSMGYNLFWNENIFLSNFLRSKIIFESYVAIHHPDIFVKPTTKLLIFLYSGIEVRNIFL